MAFLDIVVFAVYMITVLGIGFYFLKKMKLLKIISLVVVK